MSIVCGVRSGVRSTCPPGRLPPTRRLASAPASLDTRASRGRRHWARLAANAFVGGLAWLAAPGAAWTAPPVFTEGETTIRSVAEHTAIPYDGLPIGDPVRATDADGDDLTYSVDMSVLFYIGNTEENSGQIFLRRGNYKSRLTSPFRSCRLFIK